MNPEKRLRVLIVDDSAIVRKVLSETLTAERDIEVVGVASDPFVARNQILQLKPDVMTLDIEMPRMDGLTFLKKVMRYNPMPVIVISSLTQAGAEAAIQALRFGAVDVLAKPGGPYSVGELRAALASRIREAGAARVVHERTEAAAPMEALTAPATLGGVLIAIGASTGGTEAVERVLRPLPENCPPIAVVQHIPASFSLAFAKRLNSVCQMEVREAVDGDLLTPGLALVAPGNYHLLVRREGAAFRILVRDGPRVCFQRPAADVLFQSVAEAAGRRAVGVILTGMGSDGTNGLKRMKQAGSFNIAQDEASSVVFGMPREAIRAGVIDRVLPLDRIPGEILRALPALAAAS
jgi:two-component system chemotaxis response regulator CheB